MRVCKGLKICFLWTLNQVLGTVPNLIRANRKLATRIADARATSIPSSDQRLQLPLQLVKEQFEWDLRRLARIEDKARATVFGVSLSVSLPTLGLALLAGAGTLRGGELRAPSAALLCIAVLFLLASGYFALLGYKAGKVSHPQLKDNEPLVSSEEAQRIVLHCLDLNTLRILRKNNLLSASIDCLRNGLAAILALLLLAVLGAL